MEEISLDAPSRAAAFEELKRRGLTAQSLSESKGHVTESHGDGKPKLFRGIAAGAAVALLGAGALWYLLGTPDAPVPPPPPKQHRTQTPKPPAPPPKPIATNAVRKVTPPPAPKSTNTWNKPYPPQAYRPDGTLKKHSQYVKIITNKVDISELTIEQRTFKNGAEQHIAMILNTEPGTPILGEMVYGKSFVRKFLKSLDTPIVIEDTDSDEVKELKRAVQETKKVLKERYDAGEDIGEIMTNTHRELRELGLYREELEEQIRSIRKESGGKMTSQEYKDLVEAANKMLSERGAKPLESTALVLRGMEMREARRAAAKNKANRK